MQNKRFGKGKFSFPKIPGVSIVAEYIEDETIADISL